MEWEKKGLIYCPDGQIAWMNNSVLTPQPFLLDEETIRVYASFRDASGVGRIGYIDVAARDPSCVVRISSKPVLDIGDNGCFDDNGMLLGDVLRVDDKIFMYYVAFQLTPKVKFLAFSGLAVSSDGGESFCRVQRTPVMDRSDEGLFGRCIHTVLREGGLFKTWYSVIHGWYNLDGVAYPAYDIRYAESDDGVVFPCKGVSSLTCNSNEYRIGRPKVRRTANEYEMRYTSDTYSKVYSSGYATSPDGIHWERKDEQSKLAISDSGWDNEMACYPVVVETKFGVYMFYDGNGMGKTGFGYAKGVG